ncbi:Pimeloyl-ACP methyl ester carboxylesterase [Chryseolinea serpens]|uniref:Pimeloyl-ACP methyl ester carboxylesterase n=1 Tax=Chryseolinea serpens TaxID=947013 RepID=A0A1M5JVQ8_9BACT|nr:alpha/beta hydrolase [Chryseolinea serpens]SHG44608.1 Pimeloyl-ACP methyl ester carboxylesterase [Chryseolinea serpens]
MKNLVLSIAVLLTTTFTAFSQVNKAQSTSTIAIIHGAWSSASDWKQVTEDLMAAGHQVISINLPGHGSDNTAITGISLKLYVDEVKKAIGVKQNVVLVVHSFGGIVGSQVAEQIAPQIKKIIYIAAYVPKNGESLLSLAQTDAESHIGKSLIVDEKAGIATVRKEGVADVFMADAPAQVADYVSNTIKPEPLAPLATPVTLTDGKFGKINKVFVHSLNDHTIGYSLQQKMVKDAGIQRLYSLPSSHTPFIMFPHVLAQIIAVEAK